MPGSDPYRYFRLEARELLDQLTCGALALERGDPEASVAELRRHAHTLKGAARVVGVRRVADETHALEEALESLDSPPAPAALEAVLAALDAVARAVGTVEQPPSEPAPEAPHDDPSPPSSPDSAPLDASRLDTLDSSLLDARIQVRAIQRALAEADHATAQGLAQRLDDHVTRLSRDLSRAEDEARSMRLVPVRSLIPVLERAARDVCRSTGRRARLVVVGQEQRVDGTMIDALRDALVQVVCNAVAHGIQPPEERVAAGKPPEGRIELCFSREGARLRLTCSDDGRGLDHVAVQRASGDADPWRAIFAPGLSTATSVSLVSGRGVGLSVVAERIHDLGGEVAAAPAPGGGLAITLIVPISRMALRVLFVRASGYRVALPLEAVRGTLPLDGSTGDQEVLVEGEPLRVLPLGVLFRVPAPWRQGNRADMGVIVQARGGRTVLAVEALLETLEVTVRQVCVGAGRIPGVSSLVLAANGTPVPVVDVHELHLLQGRTVHETAPSRGRPLPILVVDDSLTTRMLERSILETAGYTVATASSAEEALNLAHTRDFGLFVVDVQMPGMSGIDFVRATRADERLVRVPTMLVTSLGSAEDRRRGLEAGADAYVVKGEFDQDAFLGVVAGLAVTS